MRRRRSWRKNEKEDEEAQGRRREKGGQWASSGRRTPGRASLLSIQEETIIQDFFCSVGM